MTDLIGIGAAGVSAYRTALATVGDNVVNAETAGYARRSTVLSETVAAGSVNPLYSSKFIAGGVSATAISRAWDDFKASESRVAIADASGADARMRWLTTAQTALTDGDASAKVTGFFAAADTLAGNPGGDLPRSAMLAALDDAASAIRTTADGLSRTADGIASEAQTTADSLNANLKALATINLSLRRADPASSAHAGLADERDRLIDAISGQIGVTTTLDASGAATLTLAGSNTSLLSGVTPAQLSVRQGADGRLALAVALPSGDVEAASPTGGALAGLVDAAATVADRRLQLDGIARDFATTINNWQANGVDANGQPGTALLAMPGGAATLALTTTDAAALAAASGDGTANGNLLALQPLRDGGSEQRLASLVSVHSQLVASATQQASATATRRDGTLASRDEVSGVDLDKEASDLLRFQQAYQASAKIIQTARETLQSILDIL
ncbi:MAG TPA: flagellar hook-associated protein FlgK [Sphingomonadaceae bacterium]|nr:flagellar hook-associated protein FlgK [Sphingomonadaceae bacterium]